MWCSGLRIVIVTVVALVAAVAQVQPLAQKLPHVAGVAKQNKTKQEKPKTTKKHLKKQL